MEEQETKLMVRMINAASHVGIWYSPTAFWPIFNEIKAPHITCVPDLVVTEFPVGFSLQSRRLPFIFAATEETVRTSQHFVTYSEQVKWATLVDRYGVDPAAINVVRHAVCDLSSAITCDVADAKEVKKDYCRSLLRQAILKSGNGYYITNYIDCSFRFVFYASQTRPNKNILTLLRAYEYLLRKRFISCKLVLSGLLYAQADVAAFLHEHNLAMDVLFLHGMTVPELAACYHLADLAVNPSLSEGGCPFTLTEALSVRTPVVMSRIPVTEEIVTEPDLQNLMLFDGYDWKDMANKIEWALQNRETLLARQQQLYQELASRTWGDVVDDYIAILDRISTPAAQTEATAAQLLPRIATSGKAA
jgi:glycosyltransferase involved in cell wall biosynthesis